jgi:hypothetical protein
MGWVCLQIILATGMVASQNLEKESLVEAEGNVIRGCAFSKGGEGSWYESSKVSSTS